MKFLFIFYKERLFFGKTNEKKSVLGFLLISAFNSSFCGGISVIKLTTFSSLMEIVFLLSISNWSCERNHSKVQPFISTLFNLRIPKKYWWEIVLLTRMASRSDIIALQQIQHFYFCLFSWILLVIV